MAVNQKAAAVNQEVHETVETPGPRVEPAFQGSPFPALGKNENPESEFTENDGIDGNIQLMVAKPSHNPPVGRRFRRLTQNVGVDQVLHSAPYLPANRLTANRSTQSRSGLRRQCDRMSWLLGQSEKPYGRWRRYV